MQPSRARSKNGLFIAFGTSAKRSLSCASAGCVSTKNAARAAAAVSKRFILFLPLGRLTLTSTDLAAPKAFKQDREDNENTNEGSLPIGINSGKKKAVADDFNKGGAHDGGKSPALAAQKVYSADD